jgi:hypothetical protein
LPDGAGEIWETYRRIARARQYNEAGPLGIPCQEIDAWARLNRRSLSPWEVEVICDLDATFLAVWARLRRADHGHS